MRLIICIATILLIFLNGSPVVESTDGSRIGSICKQSWECGNQPYTVCQSKFNLMKGIGVDPIEGKVYLMGRYNESNVAYGNVTIASIPMNGPGIISTEFTIKTDRIGGSSFMSTTELFKYLPKNKRFLIQGYERLSNIVSIYDDLAKVQLTPLWYPRGWSLGAHFDEDNKLSYICSDWTIKVYPKILSTQDELYGFGSAGSVALNNGTCFGISNSYKGLSPFSDTIIYATLSTDSSNKTTTFYIGSSNCVLCKREFYTLHTYFDWITGFHVFNDKVYFSSRQGIFQMNVPGTNNKLVISNDPVDSFQFVDSENSIYYISNYKVKKVNVVSLLSTTLYDSKSGQSMGVCSCASGFSGGLCKDCIGGKEQWANGNPTCVKTTQSGTPETCTEEWQCGNSPYFLCVNNECLCRPEFYGNKCDQCQGKITWSAKGEPICSPKFL